MGFLLVLCGLLSSLVGLIGYFIPAVRDVESLMLDDGVALGVHEPQAD